MNRFTSNRFPLDDKKVWILKPPAKINLHLEVLGRRPDNYHELFSLLLPLALRDKLTIRMAPNDTGRNNYAINIIWSNKIKRPVQNIPLDKISVLRALRILEKNLSGSGLLERFTGFNWQIELVKRIPPEAGLGGGSSDAGTILAALFEAMGGEEEGAFVKTAQQIGADTSFFLLARPSFWGGIGEILIDLDLHLSGLPVILLRPGFGSSTAQAYKQLGKNQVSREEIKNFRNQGKEKAENIKNALLAGRTNFLKNDFEGPLMDLYPEYKEILNEINNRVSYFSELRDTLIRIGITGSGSTVYAVFSKSAKRSTLNKIKKELKKKCPFSVLTYTYDYGLSPSGKAAGFGSAIPRFESWQAR